MRYPIFRYESAVEVSSQPVICLAHANGFPPETYIPLARRLGEQYEVVSLPARPLWGDADPTAFAGWQNLTDDYLAGIQQHRLGQVIGIGHSMGGTAILMAAVQQPTAFHAIVLLDPVMLPPPMLYMLRLMRWLPFKVRVPLERSAMRRRRYWDSVEDAYQRFRSRSLFERCSDEVVRLYTESITQSNERGIELRYTPEWEARIYHTLPTSVWRYPSQLQVPALVLAGAETDTFMAKSVATWRSQRPDLTVRVLPETGHLLPLEAPEQVAAHIFDFLNRLSEEAGDEQQR